MTSPEQLPRAYDLPADRRSRMRSRLLAEITDAGADGGSRRHMWAAPAAVAVSVLLVAGGFTAFRVLTDSRTSAPSGAAGLAGPSAGMTSPPDAASSVDEIDCGTYDLAQGEQTPDSAAHCLIAAVATGERARLQETRPSVEGAPIVTTYVVTGLRNIRVVTDARADPYGSDEVHQQNCTRVTQVDGQLSVDGCTELKAGPN